MYFPKILQIIAVPKAQKNHLKRLTLDELDFQVYCFCKFTYLATHNNQNYGRLFPLSGTYCNRPTPNPLQIMRYLMLSAPKITRYLVLNGSIVLTT